jgi:hypothetical protein
LATAEVLAKTDRLFVQNNAFNLRAAEVYADAIHDFKSSAMAANSSSAQRQPRNFISPKA